MEYHNHIFELAVQNIHFNNKFLPSSEVERVHIDVDSAMKRFRGRLLNAENVGKLYADLWFLFFTSLYFLHFNQCSTNF